MNKKHKQLIEKTNGLIDWFHRQVRQKQSFSLLSWRLEVDLVHCLFPLDAFGVT